MDNEKHLTGSASRKMSLRDPRKVSQMVIEAIEDDLLPRLQSGEETYVVVADKKPYVAVFPSLPGVTTQQPTSTRPLIRRTDAVRDRWYKDSLLGFCYVLRGEADLLLGRRVVTCHAGNLAFFLPHTWRNHGTATHWERPEPTHADCALLWVFIKPEEVLSHLCWSHGTQHIISRNLFIPENRLLPLAELLHEEIFIGQVPATATQLLWMIFDRVRRKLREERFLAIRPPAVESQAEQPTENVGERARQYIEANLMERLTLESVARAVFTSRTRLAREFSLHTGETFGVFLLRRRIERAKHLLLATPDSIKSIAWRAGFTDPDYFSAAFRRETGLTPTEFRRSAR